MQIFKIHLHFFTSDMYFYSVSSELFKILDNEKKKLFCKYNLLLSFHYYEQIPFRFIYLFFSHITTPLVRKSLKGFSYTEQVCSSVDSILCLRVNEALGEDHQHLLCMCNTQNSTQVPQNFIYLVSKISTELGLSPQEEGIKGSWETN